MRRNRWEKKYIERVVARIRFVTFQNGYSVFYVQMWFLNLHCLFFFSLYILLIKSCFMHNSLMLWVHSFGFFVFIFLFCSQDFQHKPWIQTVQTLNHSKIIYRIFTDKNVTVVFKKTKKKKTLTLAFWIFHTKSLLNISLCTHNLALLICFFVVIMKWRILYFSCLLYWLCDVLRVRNQMKIGRILTDHFGRKNTNEFSFLFCWELFYKIFFFSYISQDHFFVCCYHTLVCLRKKKIHIQFSFFNRFIRCISWFYSPFFYRIKQ